MTEDPSNRLDWFSDRARQVLGAVSVRTKILGIVLALTLALGLGVTWQVRTSTHGVLLEELDLRGSAVASDLAASSVDPILLDDTFALHQLLTQTVSSHPDVVYAFVTDLDGHVVAHTFGLDGFPVQLVNMETIGVPFVYDSDVGRIRDFAEPVLAGRVGTARVGVSEERLSTVVAGITTRMLLTTLAVAVAGIAAAVFLTWLLTRPILDLVETTRRVGAGDLSARARPWARDEIGVLAEAFNDMVEDLDDSRATIETKEAARTRLLEQLINVQEEERKRIARRLHDGVGQPLNSLVLGLSTLMQGGDSIDASAEATQLRDVTLETLDGVRRISRELRPSVLDDLGLAEALEHYAREVASLYPDLLVDTQLDLETRLSPTVEIAIYRMVQESMTNAARHSGAQTLSVVVAQRGGRTQAIIEDDGIGFDVEAMRRSGKSVGIHGIAERADLVGGDVRFESSESGTSVFIEVPA
jgi:signal transduction histidine kinase